MYIIFALQTISIFCKERCNKNALNQILTWMEENDVNENLWRTTKMNLRQNILTTKSNILYIQISEFQLISSGLQISKECFWLETKNLKISLFQNSSLPEPNQDLWPKRNNSTSVEEENQGSSVGKLETQLFLLREGRGLTRGPHCHLPTYRGIFKWVTCS